MRTDARNLNVYAACNGIVNIGRKQDMYPHLFVYSLCNHSGWFCVDMTAILISGSYCIASVFFARLHTLLSSCGFHFCFDG